MLLESLGITIVYERIEAKMPIILDKYILKSLVANKLIILKVRRFA